MHRFVKLCTNREGAPVAVLRKRRRGVPEPAWQLNHRPAAATATREDRDEEKHQEDYEEYLGNPRSSARDSAESEDARNEGDHKKDDSVVEHGFVLVWVFVGGDFRKKGPAAHKRQAWGRWMRRATYSFPMKSRMFSLVSPVRF